MSFEKLQLSLDPKKDPPKNPTTPKSSAAAGNSVLTQSKLSTVTGHPTSGPVSAREGTPLLIAVLQAKIVI